MLVFQRAALSFSKLYKSITGPKRAKSIKKNTIEINDNPRKKVNTINNNIDSNNNRSKKQSNKLKINETIEERLKKLESKVKHMLIETCEKNKETQ